MAKSKNHTTHNQSQKWQRKGVKKHQSQRHESFKGVHTKFLRNFHTVKKHNKKGLKKMQANNNKAMTTHEVKPKSPKGISHKLHQLAYTIQSKLRKHARTHIAKGHGLCQPKAKARAQTKVQVEAAAPAAVLTPAPKFSFNAPSKGGEILYSN
uniref:60S ribosomal protein L29 n=1 Tax=Ursus americanus TaxID=9643 RepID=A0A452QPB6_URSAM